MGTGGNDWCITSWHRAISLDFTLFAPSEITLMTLKLTNTIVKWRISCEFWVAYDQQMTPLKRIIYFKCCLSSTSVFVCFSIEKMSCKSNYIPPDLLLADAMIQKSIFYLSIQNRTLFCRAYKHDYALSVGVSILILFRFLRKSWQMWYCSLLVLAVLFLRTITET